MADGDGERYVFPLTSLQIGDLQSYLSHLSLFLASESGKFYILVDNRPWLEDLMLSSTHWWQLMVTKVFRALRSILNGFVVFFIACNRHRLSIYNHVKELIHRLIFVATTTWSTDKSQSGQTSEARLKKIGKSSIDYQMKRRMIAQHPYKAD
ncbi:hypothetical protein Sango_1268300 [Sesamum angolense]|uniref:Uncharacterized protein n=1 Tax=Sesamum angolense TaxID=2727404 RepID=A0AAE1WQS3_9LAMI|nr:hypothetical protein Sango_1268300 [Sesamum angolense]